MRVMSRANIALVIAGSLLVGAACKKGPAGGREQPAAHLEVDDSGGFTLVVKQARIQLPDRHASGPVLVDDGGRRFAVELGDGAERIVYDLGRGLWLGPRAARHDTAPHVDEAGAAIYEANPWRRAELVDVIRRAHGEQGVEALLVSTVAVEGPGWEEAHATLAPPARSRVNAAVDARLRGLTTADPRASASMLRKLDAVDAELVASTACAVLDPHPPSSSRGRDPFAPSLPQSRLALLPVEEAALSVLFTRAGKGVPACWDKIALALAEFACEPSVRCSEGKPVGAKAASDQSEPLCTRDELSRAAARVRALPSPELDEQSRIALLAFGALAAADRVPEAFVRAHARRRYRIVQSAGPACDASVTGLPCRCSAPVMREFACRAFPGSAAASSYCQFTVDDARRQIRGSIGTEPP